MVGESDGGVFANFHATDRLLRVRFARELVESRLFVTVTIRLEVGGDGNRASSSLGLLRAVGRVLAQRHLRVDRCSNQYIEGDDDAEVSEWTVTAKAVDAVGESFASSIDEEDKHGKERVCIVLSKAIKEAAGSPPDWHDLSLTIARGFARDTSVDEVPRS